MEEHNTKFSNLTVNSSLSAENPTEWATWQVVVTTFPMSLLIAQIILGNLLVIVAVLTQRQLRTPSNMIILSMAIADLAIGIFIMPFNIADMISGWTFGPVLCRIWLTSDVTLCTTSILHISAIAVDRFRSINEGVSYAQSKTIRMSLLACGGLWFIAVWISSSPVLGWNDWKEVDPTQAVMECALTNKLGYIIHSATGAFFIPTAIMILLYFRIYILIRNKLRDRLRLPCQAASKSESTRQQVHLVEDHSSEDILKENATNSKKIDSVAISSIVITITDDESSKTQRKPSEQIECILKNKKRFSLTKERKAAKTLGIIIGTFITCWTPFVAVYMTNGVLIEYGMEIPGWLFQTVTWLGYVNSGLNPVIYTIYNSEFRRAFRIIWEKFQCIGISLVENKQNSCKQACSN